MKYKVPEPHERNGEIKGCLGVKMLDGTLYKANRQGTIEITDPTHIREVQQDKSLNNLMDKQGIYFNTKEKLCECGFCAFSWQAVCPKCKKEI